MYNQTEAVLAQYELEIRQITKGRGSYICDTDKGKKLLVPFRGSKERGEWLKQYLERISEAGFTVEQIYSNKNAEAVTMDEVTGESFIIKDQIAGMELNTAHFGEMLEAVEVLAEYHLVAEQVLAEEVRDDLTVDIVDTRMRHHKELIKVRNYIRGRKKKMEFERLYMDHFPKMLISAKRSIEILEQQASLKPKCVICHGDCNQHNMVWAAGAWHMIHFENVVYSWVVWDLANFIRKMLEKNGWDAELGMELVKAYDKIRPLGRDGYLQLYALLLFPEKFWKVTNHYMNSNKAWVPARDIEKLQKVIEQEPKRLNFAENLFSNLME